MFTHKVSVVIPARNEEKTIGSVIIALQGHPFIGEIIVVDSASTDNTKDCAVQHGAKVLPLNRSGFGLAMKEGILAAKNSWVFKLDADMTNVSGKWLSMAIDKASPDTSLVKGYWDSAPDLLPMTNLALKPTIKLVIPELAYVKMPTSGIYLFKKNEIDINDMSDDFTFDLELLVRFHRLNKKIRQVYLGEVLDTIKPISNYIETSALLLKYLHTQGTIWCSEPIIVITTSFSEVMARCGGVILKYLSLGVRIKLFTLEETMPKINIINIYRGFSYCKIKKNIGLARCVDKITKIIKYINPKVIINNVIGHNDDDSFFCYSLAKKIIDCTVITAKVNKIYFTDSFVYEPISYQNGIRLYFDISDTAELKYQIIRSNQKGVTSDFDSHLEVANFDKLNGVRCGANIAESLIQIDVQKNYRPRNFF